MAQSDVIVGVFTRENLTTGLVAVHRAGLGPQARVLDSARGQLDVQLRTSGHQLPMSFAADDTDTVLILVSAPGRAALAADTLSRAGARAVHGTERPTSEPDGQRQVATREPATVVEQFAPPADPA